MCDIDIMDDFSETDSFDGTEALDIADPFEDLNEESIEFEMDMPEESVFEELEGILDDNEYGNPFDKLSLDGFTDASVDEETEIQPELQVTSEMVQEVIDEVAEDKEKLKNLKDALINGKVLIEEPLDDDGEAGVFTKRLYRNY